jgi:hypothetical protein
VQDEVSGVRVLFELLGFLLSYQLLACSLINSFLDLPQTSKTQGLKPDSSHELLRRG